MGGRARQRKLRKEAAALAGRVPTTYVPGQGQFIVGQTVVYWAPNVGGIVGAWKVVPEPLASEVRRRHVAREAERRTAEAAGSMLLPPGVELVAEGLERPAPFQEGSRP